MNLHPLDFDITVCQVAQPFVNQNTDFFFLSRTAEEISLVCKTAEVPQHTLNREDGWRGFFIEGVLDFSLIGILARIAGILAENQISIFALSTYNTDYVLVKKEHFEKALQVLSQNGFSVQ